MADQTVVSPEEPEGDDFLLRRIRDDIARDLDAERPNRYTVSDSTEETDDLVEADDDHEGMGWIDEVGDRHAERLPEAVVRKMHARKIAREIESQNLQRGNRALRREFEDPQLGIEPVTRLNYPITVVHRITKKGERPRIRRERIRLAAATSEDFRLFAKEGRRESAKRFEVENRTYRYAEETADKMDEGGHRTYLALAESQAGEEDVSALNE